MGTVCDFFNKLFITISVSAVVVVPLSLFVHIVFWRVA